MKNQRASYKKQKLINEKIKLLTNMNFVWSNPEFTWNIRLNELRQFKKMHGHAAVPKRYEHLPEQVKKIMG